MDANIPCKKAVQHLVLPHEVGGILIAVKEAIYDEITDVDHTRDRIYGFVVEDWLQTKEISHQLKKAIDANDEERNFYFSALTLEWLEVKQGNGLLMIASVLVGIVFFTFAASFIYFRLYTDLERDQQQYKMIGKIGLSKRELKGIVTRQLLLMFFYQFSLR